MKTKFFAGLALALCLLAPAFSAPAKFEAGALAVEQVSDKGPALILIPGLACGPWVWADTTARLRGKYSIYLLTLPGFDGRKPVPGATLESLSRDLATLIESRKIRKPVLVGHSLGGTLSLAFAAEHSGLITGVIAVDGLPVFPGTESMTGDRSALGQRMRAQIEGQTPEQFPLGQQAYMKQVGSLDEAIAMKLAESSSRSDIGATADFAAQLMIADLRPRLPGIKVPVVEISPFNAPDFAAIGVDENRKTGYYRMLLSGIEKLDVVSISPSRHFVMFDQPEKFAAALDGALATMVESPSEMTAGYSGTPLAKKLGLKPDQRVSAPGAPPNYRKLLAPLPDGIEFQARVSKTTDLVHLFTTSRVELEKNLTAWLKLLAADAAIWVSWPKKTSKVPTDITEDTIRAVALPMGLVDIKVCAVDETWSGLKLVLRKELRAK